MQGSSLSLFSTEESQAPLSRCLGQTLPWVLGLAVSLVLSDHNTSSSLGYCSQSQHRQPLTPGQTAQWAFLIYHYNTFSKIEYVFSNSFFWNFSYITAHMPKHCVTASQIICKTVLVNSLLSDNLLVYLGISGCHKYSILEALSSYLSPPFLGLTSHQDAAKLPSDLKYPTWQKLPHEAQGH